MFDPIKRKTVDLLVEQFWKHGYLTISRKYGTYLPEPAKIGSFDVDIIAKHKSDYAIGITISGDEFNDPKISERIKYLATRQTKYSNKRVLLFIGTPALYYKNARILIDLLDQEIRKNIRLLPINDRPVPSIRKSRERGKILFS